MPVYRLHQSSVTAVADSTCPQTPILAIARECGWSWADGDKRGLATAAEAIKKEASLVQCMSPLLAQSGHSLRCNAMSAIGGKADMTRTRWTALLKIPVKSTFPSETWGRAILFKKINNSCEGGLRTPQPSEFWGYPSCELIAPYRFRRRRWRRKGERPAARCSD